MELRLKKILTIFFFIISSQLLAQQVPAGQWFTTMDDCKVFIPVIEGEVFKEISKGLEKQKLQLKWTGNCSDGLVDGIGVLLVLKKKKILAKYEGAILKGKYLTPKKPDSLLATNTHSAGDTAFVQLFYLGKGQQFEAFYRGTVKGYKMHGLGELVKFDGTKYTGGFKDGLYDGYGELVEKEGVLYRGTFSGGEFDGRGYLLAKNGTHFIGEFRNGAIDGIGEMNYVLSSTKYKGEWYNDYYHGTGVFTFENGNYLKARFRKSIPLYGVYVWKNGDKYYGELNKDWDFEGKGILFHEKDAKFKCGIWDGTDLTTKLSMEEVSNYLRQLDGVMFNKMVEKI